MLGRDLSLGFDFGRNIQKPNGRGSQVSPFASPHLSADVVRLVVESDLNQDGARLPLIVKPQSEELVSQRGSFISRPQGMDGGLTSSTLGFDWQERNEWIARSIKKCFLKIGFSEITSGMTVSTKNDEWANSAVPGRFATEKEWPDRIALWCRGGLAVGRFDRLLPESVPPCGLPVVAS